MEWLHATGPLMYPLVILSLAALTLIIERSLFFMRQPAPHNSEAVQLIVASLDAHVDQPKAIRDELASVMLHDVTQPYLFGVQWLRFIAVISPMVGLLGTVLGIIDAFTVISLHTGPVTPALIADGLWVAMLTTALGLSIALPCLVAAFLFARLGQKRISRIERVLNQHSLALEGVQLSASTPLQEAA